MKRTLRLTRETLTELTADDLASVAGAAPDAIRTLDVLMCLTLHRTCILTTV